MSDLLITNHQYLEKYPISKDSQKLIVGTIHPHFHEEFKIPFFYGNVLSIWTILNEAFPDELIAPITLDGVLNFLKTRKISLSDTIKVCSRVNPNALDRDLVPIELNKQMLFDIANSKITEIFFTSGFGKNNAFKLFYTDMLGLKITPEIRRNRSVVIDENVFGRKVKLIVLYSPSGSSNVGMSKSQLYLANKQKYTGSKRPVMDFKVDYYKDNFKG